MLQLDRWTKSLGLAAVFFMLIGCIFWAEKQQACLTCQGIDIYIADIAGQRFVEESNLLHSLIQGQDAPIVGTLLQQIASKKIENTIKSHNFVYIVKVYKNWKGRLKIRVVPRRPIARILHANRHDQYIDEQGLLLPLSANYTARVLAIDGKNLVGVGKQLKDSQYGLALFQLLTLLDQDPFWHAQINHISMDEQGNLTLFTQLGKQIVSFGQPDNISKKMEKLKLFYKVIIPYKGWNTYKRLTLKFDNQIVCE